MAAGQSGARLSMNPGGEEMSRKRIVILGGGTGGTMTANRLRHRFDSDEAEIHVVDRDDKHVYQPGLLFVPFGLAQVGEIVRPRRRQLRNGVVFHENEVEEVWIERDEVLLDDGTVLSYDVLVTASGVRLQPEETEGLTGPGWNERVFTFYSPEGADALRGALQRFEGGRLVVNLVDMPIKCPVAPLEFAFLADWYLRERGIRSRVELVYSTPLDGAFTKPIASERLAGLLAEKEIELVTEFNAGEVDGVGGKLVAGYDGHANCFIETGFQKALLIDFNYETEPLPGHFPTAVGLPLLRESRLNHLGKLLFQWVYWHALLPGRELPGIGPAMPAAGKQHATAHTP